MGRSWVAPWLGLGLLVMSACADDGSAGGVAPKGDGGAGDARASSTVGAPGTSPPLGAPVEGIATYYAATGAGACSYDPSPNDLMVTAMNAEQYAGSGACGTCIDVRGPKGSARVRVVDLCPECKSGHLDLSKEAFAKVADVSAGRVNITWTPVRCDVTSPVRYRLKDGSSQWWTAIQVLDHALPIAKMELVGGNASPIPRESYNYFVRTSGVGAAPYRVRITASTGAVLEDVLPAPKAGDVITGQAQFP